MSRARNIPHVRLIYGHNNSPGLGQEIFPTSRAIYIPHPVTLTILKVTPF